MKFRKYWMMVLPIAFLAAIIFAGCGGSDGKNGSNGKSAYDIAVENGFTGTEQEWLASLAGGSWPGDGSWFGEYCNSCHAQDGQFHQANYDALYQVGVIEVSNLAYAYSTASSSDIVTFNMTKDGYKFDCTGIENLNIYYSEYMDSAPNMAWGVSGGERLSIKGTVSYMDSTNTCESIAARNSTTVALGDLADTNGIVAVYGRDHTIAPIAGHGQQNMYPYAAVEVLGTVDYTSNANATACENCHTKPYLKHGYIAGYTEAGVDDFYICKVCHLDNGEGGHDWKFSVDNPVAWANGETGDATLYAYKTRLMNDVHMSHSMEFEYPQSMSNCATCHAGKLTQILDSANFFNLETCKSCHPVVGDPDYPAMAPALLDILPTTGTVDHTGFIDMTDYSDASLGCAGCHTTGPGPRFDQIHTGYNPIIYDATGERYSDYLDVAIDSADFSANSLSITVIASGNLGSVHASDIVPVVSVGLYGKLTKDFVAVADAADNAFSVIDSTGGDYVWQGSVDLSQWQDMIPDTVQRVAIMVRPELPVMIPAVSETFNLTSNSPGADPYDQTVDVNKCNKCHDALGTTFHTNSDGTPEGRGGDIVVCKSCHVTYTGASHLEMQSRGIDSYVHAIHANQQFNVGIVPSSHGTPIDFTDPVELKHYEEGISFVFPTLGVDCMACHNEGTFDVPSQVYSMPGVLSKSGDTLTYGGWDRNIKDVPAYVTGPAVRACGACHRAAYIKADDAQGLEVLNQHFENFGYLVESDSKNVLRDYIIQQVFEIY